MRPGHLPMSAHRRGRSRRSSPSSTGRPRASGGSTAGHPVGHVIDPLRRASRSSRSRLPRMEQGAQAAGLGGGSRQLRSRRQHARIPGDEFEKNAAPCTTGQEPDAATGCVVPNHAASTFVAGTQVGTTAATSTGPQRQTRRGGASSSCVAARGAGARAARSRAHARRGCDPERRRLDAGDYHVNHPRDA